jgi:hypothetical protein
MTARLAPLPAPKGLSRHASERPRARRPGRIVGRVTMTARLASR